MYMTNNDEKCFSQVLDLLKQYVYKGSIFFISIVKSYY